MPLWTPELMDTALWLDAADADTITIDTGVSQWDDKSGNGYVFSQGVAANQPTLEPSGFNGNPSLLFDGTSDFLSAASGPQPGANNAMVLAVVNSIPASVYGGRVISFMSGSSTRFSLMAYIAENSWSFNHSSSFNLVNRPYSSGQHIVGGYRNGTTKAVGLDGGVYTTSGLGETVPTMDSWIVGAYDASLRLFNGQICEIVYVADYDADTLQKLEGYLAHKWGLEANLPVGHPYELAAPFAGSISGTVTNASGGPAARTIRAYSRATGVLVGETVSDIATGAWEIALATDTDPGEVTVLALADEVEVYNDIAHRVIPA